MSAIVVSNTGPLITLEKLEDGYEFIRKVVSQILIPQKVAEEISIEFPSIEEYMEFFQINDLIKIRQIEQISEIPGIYQLDD